MQQQIELHSSEQENKQKLIRLFRAFCGLCNKFNKSKLPILLNLIEGYILGQVDVNEIIQNIIIFANFKPSNNLQPFLETNIGLLRRDFESGELSVNDFLHSEPLLHVMIFEKNEMVIEL